MATNLASFELSLNVSDSDFARITASILPNAAMPRPAPVRPAPMSTAMTATGSRSASMSMGTAATAKAPPVCPAAMSAEKSFLSFPHWINEVGLMGLCLYNTTNLQDRH